MLAVEDQGGEDSDPHLPTPEPVAVVVAGDKSLPVIPFDAARNLPNYSKLYLYPPEANSDNIVCKLQSQFKGGVCLEVELPPNYLSWVNPKLESMYSEVAGRGMFCRETVEKDEKLILWTGRLVPLAEVIKLPEEIKAFSLQMDDEVFQIPVWPNFREPADYTNHSCDANAGFGGNPNVLVAMRRIEPGEEIVFDYALCESRTEYGNFRCLCDSKRCRGQFTGSDWRLPELQERYGNYFSPYLLKKIHALKSERKKLESGA